jgi:hypothetical protein
MNIHKLSLLTGVLMLVSSLVTGCNPSQPIATILILDKSASALEDKQFAEIASQSCHTYAKSLLPNDFAGQIPVNGNAPRASDLTQVLDPRLYHRNCQQSSDATLVSATAPNGTFSCPAWDLAHDLTHRQTNSSLPVLYVSIIQTNEMEAPCPDVWRSLADDAQKRHGKLVIAGSSVGDAQNAALDGSFNQLLWQELKDSPSVVFCEEDAQGCIEQAFREIRTNQAKKQQKQRGGQQK